MSEQELLALRAQVQELTRVVRILVEVLDRSRPAEADAVCRIGELPDVQ